MQLLLRGTSCIAKEIINVGRGRGNVTYREKCDEAKLALVTVSRLAVFRDRFFAEVTERSLSKAVAHELPFPAGGLC